MLFLSFFFFHPLLSKATLKKIKKNTQQKPNPFKHFLNSFRLNLNLQKSEQHIPSYREDNGMKLFKVKTDLWVSAKKKRRKKKQHSFASSLLSPRVLKSAAVFSGAWKPCFEESVKKSSPFVHCNRPHQKEVTGSPGAEV